jgi:hypothetical protein
MLLIDNTVEINKSLNETLISFINGKDIVSKIYTVTKCDIHNKPRLTGRLKREGMNKPIPNRLTELQEFLPQGYELRAIFGYLYLIVEI